MLSSSHQTARFFVSAKTRKFDNLRDMTAINDWPNGDVLLQSKKSYMTVFKTVDREWICY